MAAREFEQLLILSRPFTLDGDEIPAVVVRELTGRQVKDWQERVLAGDENAEMPMIYTPGGRLLTGDDMLDILDNDLAEIDEAVARFFPKRLRRWMGQVQELIETSSPPSQPSSDGPSSTSSTSDGPTSSDGPSSPEKAPAQESAG